MLKNKMDADDVTQEVMIRIWNNMDRFSLFAAKTWIMKTANNLCIDYLRRNSAQKKRETGIDDEFEECYESHNSSDNPHNLAHINMMMANVKRALEKLPEELRSVFILYQINGLKYREISKALDIPLNTVKVNLLRARKYLQKELKGYLADEVI
jgi:RNA polymerase sigma-70 factor (ECF subfamily)